MSRERRRERWDTRGFSTRSAGHPSREYRGDPGRRVGGHADRAYMHRDGVRAGLGGCSTFSITFLLFLFARATGSESPREKERERRRERRVGGTNDVRFVVSENRVLIAWMPSRTPRDRPASTRERKRLRDYRYRMLRVFNMRRTVPLHFSTGAAQKF